MRATRWLSLPCLLVAVASHAAAVDTAFPAFGGPLPNAPAVGNVAASCGDTLFLGGSLRWAGPLTGGGVPIAGASLAPLAGFPRVNGHVLAAAPDGAGGWFIGGAFTHVGGQPHANLAHVRYDLSVDAWTPTTNGDVIAIVATASDVYLGGPFTAVNGVPSSGFAAVDRAHGVIVSNPPMNGLVAALATDGTRVYLGGEFTSAGGVARTRLAAYRAWDHRLTPWTAPASGGVYALAIANGVVYAGGRFTSVSGLPRAGAAALDLETAAPTAWRPALGGAFDYGVRAILPVGDRVYLGGDFGQVGGVPRRCLAEVDGATGALRAWDPQVTFQTPGIAGATVSSLEMAGDHLLVGGLFDHAGGIPRANLARLDTLSGAADPAAPEAPGETRALAASGACVFVGGRFSTFAAARRSDLVALRISTGETLPWAPAASLDVTEMLFGEAFHHASSVVAMAVDGARVYAAVSFFDAFLGRDRQAVRAYDRATGALAWSVEPQGMVRALARADTLLFVGGDELEPSPPRGLAALSAATGVPVALAGSVTGVVTALLPTPEGLVVGGVFAEAGGERRNNLALLDTGTGLAADWDPDPDDAVWALALDGNTLFCGGDFTRVGGEPRARLASIALDTGAPDAWNPGANASVRSLVFRRGVLYAGGGFTALAGQARACLGALRPDNGAALPLDPAITPGHTVLSVAAAAGHVFAAGSQTAAGFEPTTGLTAMLVPDDLLDARGPTYGRRALQVEPQPARSVARVRFTLPRPTDAQIDLYDLTGRRIAVLAPWGHLEAGEHTVTLAPHRLPAGLYVVRVTSEDGGMSGKLLVVP